jgi:hypothetical protein
MSEMHSSKKTLQTDAVRVVVFMPQMASYYGDLQKIHVSINTLAAREVLSLTGLF